MKINGWGKGYIMKQFTCVQVKEVGIHDMYDELSLMAEALSDVAPLKCFMFTGHLLANEVIETPEIIDIVNRTYVNKTYLLEIDLMEYEDGNDAPHDESELGYVIDNIDRLCSEGLVYLLNADYISLDIKDV